MKALLKKIFKKRESILVYRADKVYKFRTLSEAAKFAAQPYV